MKEYFGFGKAKNLRNSRLELLKLQKKLQKYYYHILQFLDSNGLFLTVIRVHYMILLTLQCSGFYFIKKETFVQYIRKIGGPEKGFYNWIKFALCPYLRVSDKIFWATHHSALNNVSDKVFRVSNNLGIQILKSL